MKANPNHDLCYYCGAVVTKGHAEYDHFPVPQDAGGAETVLCCVSCHDMKDRIKAGNWPDDWVAKVVADFPKLSRETKIFLAKCVRVYAHAVELELEGHVRKVHTARGATKSDSGFENLVKARAEMKKKIDRHDQQVWAVIREITSTGKKFSTQQIVGELNSKGICTRTGAPWSREFVKGLYKRARRT